MKFKAGDYIIAKGATNLGFEAKAFIKGTSWNSIHQEEEYIVKWDHYPRECSYKPSDVDHLWELDSKGFITVALPVGYSIDAQKLTPEIFCNAYNHDWKVYDSGFSRFEYCARCNKERL